MARSMHSVAAASVHGLLRSRDHQCRCSLQVSEGVLLTGEEVVTKESFISVCWRLIPYWLNNWEQQWGAECSSMMFELPHFAIELLVVLPCVQVILIAAADLA